jgi:hypothetical protein
MTKEERARIARENGSKSHGPKTDAGKAASSRNAIKTGEHATKLELFVPPHSAVLCNEERQDYARLVERLLGVYRPVNDVATSIVRAIAIARWEIERLRACMTMHWNLALVENAELSTKVAPELLEMHAMIRASSHLYAYNGPFANSTVKSTNSKSASAVWNAAWSSSTRNFQTMRQPSKPQKTKNRTPKKPWISPKTNHPCTSPKTRPRSSQPTKSCSRAAKSSSCRPTT